MQPDRRETARDGRAGECGRPGNGVQPLTFWVKPLGPGGRHGGRGFGKKAAVLPDSRGALGARAPSHAPTPLSEGLDSSPMEQGGAGFTLLRRLRILDPSLQ